MPRVSIRINEITFSSGDKNSFTIKEYYKDGNCIKNLRINGNDISDSFEVPCSTSPMNFKVKDNIMIVGDTENYSFCLFSDTPSTLILINDGKCTKKTYTTNGQTLSNLIPMCDADCAAVQHKIKDKIAHWQECSKDFEELIKFIFTPGFPFNIQWSYSSNCRPMSYGTRNSNSQSYTSLESCYEQGESEGNKFEPTEYGNEHMSRSSNYSENTCGSHDTFRDGSTSWWNKWGNDFTTYMEETMKKVFPPGFPFNK